MKKIAACLSVVAIAAITLVSCSKKGDYTCTCTIPGVTTSAPVKYTDVKKSDAQKSCDALNTQTATTIAGSSCTLN